MPPAPTAEEYAALEQETETLKETLRQKAAELETLAAEKEQELEDQRLAFAQEKETEKQYDVLTGLYRWEIFREKAGALLSRETPPALVTGVCLETAMEPQLPQILPRDLPGEYLLALGRELKEVPDSLFARNPEGDLLGLVWGETEEELTQRLQDLLSRAEKKAAMLPPEGICIRRTILGTARYAGTEPEGLLARAKLAAYLARQEGGQGITPFDREGSILLTGQDALRELLEKKQVGFLFQPIVRRSNAKVVGYQLIPFSRNPKLETMEDVTALARYLGKETELEKLLWLEGMALAMNQMSQGRMLYNTKIWMKTGTCLTEAAAREFSEGYFDYLKNLVLELPVPALDNLLELTILRRQAKQWNIQTVAACGGLDRAGELTLLTLEPELIRLKAEAIRGITADKEKQAAFTALKAYAGERKAEILAEGIEDAADLKMVVQLGADYLQGDYLSKAETFPADLPEKRIAQIGQAQYRRRS